MVTSVHLISSTTLSIASCAPELLVNMSKEQKQIYGGPFYLYMGATPGNITSSYWPVLPPSCFLTIYFIALVTYKVLKDRSNIFKSLKFVQKDKKWRNSGRQQHL